jgi:hypothetical protein
VYINLLGESLGLFVFGQPASRMNTTPVSAAG